MPETIDHDKKLVPMRKTKIGFSFDKWDVILGFFSELNELFDECLGHGCIIWKEKKKWVREFSKVGYIAKLLV